MKSETIVSEAKGNNENFNAGCYSMADIMKQIEQRRLQKSINELVVFLLLACMFYFLMFAMGCGNWQAHIGVSEYNSNNETRAFKTEDKKKP